MTMQEELEIILLREYDKRGHYFKEEISNVAQVILLAGFEKKDISKENSN